MNNLLASQIARRHEQPEPFRPENSASSGLPRFSPGFVPGWNDLGAFVRKALLVSSLRSSLYTGRISAQLEACHRVLPQVPATLWSWASLQRKREVAQLGARFVARPRFCWSSLCHARLQRPRANATERMFGRLSSSPPSVAGSPACPRGPTSHGVTCAIYRQPWSLLNAAGSGLRVLQLRLVTC